MERDLSIFSVASGVVGAVAIALDVGIFAYSLGHDNGERDANAAGKVQQAQVYNEQLRTQLAAGQHVVAHLSVDSTANSFSFETVDPAAQNEQCTGNYSLRQDQAVATGKLACVTMVPVR